jgi:hypothetical protein
LRYKKYVNVFTEPTALGDAEIDPFHKYMRLYINRLLSLNCYIYIRYSSIKCIRKKPVGHFFSKHTSQFLLIDKAARDGYITLKLKLTGDYLWTDIAGVYASDRFDDNAKQWNEQRFAVDLLLFTMCVL